MRGHRCAVLALATLTGAAVLAPARTARTDTRPSIWDFAEDPPERGRWDLHVQIEQLLHRPETEDVPPSIRRRDQELRLEAARALLEEAGAAGSPDVRLRFDLGNVYEQLASLQKRVDLFQSTVDVLEPALAAAPDHPAATRALGALAEAYAELDRPRDEVDVSRRYIVRIADSRERVQTMMNMGEAEMRLGRLDDALDSFREVLEICGTMRNSVIRNDIYALTLWDVAVALDRSGDARAAVDTAAKARRLTWLNWEVPGPDGQPSNVTGWDAIRDHENAFFVPDWEREWYLALGEEAAARDEQSLAAAAASWAAAEQHWAMYVTRAAGVAAPAQGAAEVTARDHTWLAIARVRLGQARVQRAGAEERARKTAPRGEKGGGPTDAEHPL
jgi:tetratricopeptide (TPR) repeat protein